MGHEVPAPHTSLAAYGPPEVYVIGELPFYMEDLATLPSIMFLHIDGLAANSHCTLSTYMYM